ncbi:HAMP domain-containing histidine kinase [Sphingomonas gei]|uniref:histidine kinase n=1 Tax=Sphingomonas gei TaxID=1395960 RepID=A0A4S1XFE4_9SPHN|nr:ATP-binding protein [Sphingomonas gei]TGX54791.1 HAMP domain-containing histidine kinase [Sphingomonas gei]
MDAPLLALTRRAAGTLETAAAENMRQLVQLRWIAVAGQTLTILLVHFGLRVPLPVIEMLGVVLALACANLLGTIALPRHRVYDGEIMVALLLDMAALTLQLYFSGGATNPFISLYLLQVVLGAILLPSAAVAVLVSATALSYALLSVSYVPLALPQGLLVDSPALFAAGRWLAFVMVASLLVLFITRISRNLRTRDTHVADLRQHAAQEDGIVRMGLFASGAAHELGTPLGTLAVILADWRRMPAVIGDPELASEVEEMRAEVQRCKAIVSDILHSAGQPRGEAMEGQPAGPYLDAVAEAWQATHPHVPLDYVRDAAGGAVIAVDAALRQAIWNLLDNAAEASPAGVRLTASADDRMLAVTVVDWGDGFSPEALAQIGKLYQSTKGAGHGVGLFLAINVARRLGGRLEASNRVGGGAEVRLLLPLAQRQGEH